MTTDFPRPLRVGVDLDGVVYPFVASLREHAVTHHARDRATLPDPAQWDFAAAWGMTSAELVELMHDGVDNGDVLLDQDPYPGVVRGLTQLRAAGHTIHIITDRAWLGRRDKVAEARTVAWLARHDVPYDTLHFAADKTSTGLALDVFIEDRPKNYRALIAAGVDAFLRSHPYNVLVPTPHSRRVPDFTTFTSRVLELAA